MYSLIFADRRHRIAPDFPSIALFHTLGGRLPFRRRASTTVSRE